MKAVLFITIVQLSLIFTYGQEPTGILKVSYKKCQSVYNGYYEMTKQMKQLTSKDTSEISFNCLFRKLPHDTIYSSAFHYKIFGNKKYQGEILYTGDDFVRAFPADSSATVMSKSLWAKEIKSYSHNYIFYTPLTNKTSAPIPHDSDFIDNKHFFKFIGIEKVNGLLCDHIKVNEVPDNTGKGKMKSLRQEYHFWINKADSIPVKYSFLVEMVMNRDTVQQYEAYTLNKYEINIKMDPDAISLNSIPDNYKIKDFVPYKSLGPLRKGTSAPDWELPSLTNERINLKDLRGNLVLINFFYMGSYSCLRTLPVLNELNEKYKDSGLRIIGINPFDKLEDDIADFLTKRGVTYTVLLEGKDVAQDYRISGYPTIYLIDKSGKIIYVQSGYRKNTDATLEKIINDNL